MSDIHRINKTEILADMAKLAEEAGDWKDHIQFEAAVAFYEREDVRTIWKEHVDACAYCREAIEVFRIYK